MAILLAAALVAFSTITAVAHDKDPIASTGASLAQGSVKFQGSARLSELGPADPMHELANLDDAFDYTSKFNGDDTEVFDVRELLVSPSLYFAISLVIGVALFWTSNADREIAHTQPDVPTMTPKAEESKHILGESKTCQPEALQSLSEAETCQSEAVHLPRLRLEISNTSLAPTTEAKSEESRDDMSKALLAAADACKAGEASSYANFCKVLAAHSKAL